MSFRFVSVQCPKMPARWARNGSARERRPGQSFKGPWAGERREKEFD